MCACAQRDCYRRDAPVVPETPAVPKTLAAPETADADVPETADADMPETADADMPETADADVLDTPDTNGPPEMAADFPAQQPPVSNMQLKKACCVTCGKKLEFRSCFPQDHDDWASDVSRPVRCGDCWDAHIQNEVMPEMNERIKKKNSKIKSVSVKSAKEPAKKKPRKQRKRRTECKCGAKTHVSIRHLDCPLNPRNLRRTEGDAHTCIHMHTPAHAHTCTCTCTHTCTHINTHVHAYTHAHAHICILNTQILPPASVPNLPPTIHHANVDGLKVMHTRMHACMHTHMHTHMHIAGFYDRAFDFPWDHFDFNYLVEPTDATDDKPAESSKDPPSTPQPPANDLPSTPQPPAAKLAVPAHPATKITPSQPKKKRKSKCKKNPLEDNPPQVNDNIIARWSRKKWFLSHVTHVTHDPDGEDKFTVYFLDGRTKKDLCLHDLRPVKTRANIPRRTDMLGRKWWFDGSPDLAQGHWRVRSIQNNTYRCSRVTGDGPTNFENFDIGYVIRTITNSEQRRRERGPRVR